MVKKGYETYMQIKMQIVIFESEAGKFYDSGNKVAGRQARMALDKIAQLNVQWRKETR